MQTFLPAWGRRPAEMLYNICQIHFLPRNSRIDQCAIQKGAGRSDEGMALDVLTVARLLANEHDGCAGGAFAEYGLRGVLVKIAALTAGGGFSELGQRC